MTSRTIFYFLFLLTSFLPVYAQGQHRLPVAYLDAQKVVDMAKSADKPYLWLVIYVPKCAHGPEQFKERAAYYRKHKDKLNLVMLSILYSDSNVDTATVMSRLFDFETTFYAMDTMYAKEDLSKRPYEFISDLNHKLGVKDELFQHVIINKRGELVYSVDGEIDFKKVDKLLRQKSTAKAGK